MSEGGRYRPICAAVTEEVAPPEPNGGGVTRVSRRSLLGGAALGAAATALGPNVRAASRGPVDRHAPGASPGWGVPASTLPSDPARCPVEHIGVLMMENRSYDTYFGWLEGGRGFLELDLDLAYRDPESGEVGVPTHWAPAYRRCGHPDPDHGWDAGRAQLRDGFLAGRNDAYALAYYRPEDIPTTARLARQFTAFDRYFCSVLGPTYPNRHYQHAATSGGTTTTELPFAEYQQVPPGFRFPTIWDRLDEAGLSSAYNFVDLPFIAMYGERHLDKLRPISQFYVDAALGTLPNVYFVEPGFLGDQRTDDHPGGADMNASQAYINNVVRAVTESPQWPASALFVNYDEWGGFFDHVVPPRVPDERASDDPATDFGQLGFRIPVLAVSPYSRKGYVHHDGPYEHTSILKFVEWRWGLAPLTVRDRHAKNIGEAFDWTQAPRHEIGIRQMETPRFFASGGCEPAGGEPDAFTAFAESRLLRSLGIAVAEPDLEVVLGNAGPVLTVAPAAGAVAGELLRR